MEETLTDYLINIRDDLSQLKRVREYLDSNKQSQGSCIVTWRTMEAFNSILSLCTSLDTPEIEALDTILDSFHHIAIHNNEESVWTNFESELGVICVKILSAIEHTDKFESLFCKLLTVIDSICQRNSDIWKAVARPILNVFINKRFSFEHLEPLLDIYLTIIQGVESFVLHNFGVQNLSHLKTLSMLVEGMGDFETQMNIMKLVFLHVFEKKLLDGFFTKSKPLVRNLFQTLHFVDFESDCRIFLNALNKEAADRKIFSICCNMMSLGGCFIGPPKGKTHVWLDANKDSERLSLKCSDFESSTLAPQIIFIQFSNVLAVRFETHTKNPASYSVTIKTKHLNKIQKGTKNSDILCVAFEADNGQKAVVEFVDFLKEILTRNKKKKKMSGKLSRTLDEICIERDSGREATLQEEATSSSVFDKNRTQSSWEIEKTPMKSTQEKNDNNNNRNIILETQELTPSSFVESLNKNLGISPEDKHSFEDSVKTVIFPQSSGKKTHTLFRSSQEFHFLEPNPEPECDFLFDKNKIEFPKPKQPPKPKRKYPSVQSTRVLRSRNREPKLTNSQSQECFLKSNTEKKKPTMPKLKKKKCTSTKRKEVPVKKQPKSSPKESDPVAEPSRPSLLDPDGYCYQRWIKPTTSERSNFWLRKLNEVEKSKTKPTTSERSNFWLRKLSEVQKSKTKPTTSERSNPRQRKRNEVQKNKTKSDRVYDFSEDSEPEIKWRAVTKRVQKPKKLPKNSKNPLIEMLKVKPYLMFSLKHKTPPRKSLSISAKNTPQEPLPPPLPPTPPPAPVVPERVLESPQLPQLPSPVSKISKEDINDPSDLSEDEAKTQKRLQSDEENSLTKTLTKKKPKTSKLPSVKLPPSALEQSALRIQKKEEKARHQTEEIIQTIDKATDHFLDHLWKKRAVNMASYINTAEEVAVKVEQNEDLNNTAKSIEKVMTYFEAECSVSSFWGVVEEGLERMKTAWKKLTERRVDVTKAADRISERLKDSIKTEIERSIQADMEAKKKQLDSIVNHL